MPKFKNLLFITLKWGCFLGLSLVIIQLIFSIKLMENSDFEKLKPLLTIICFIGFIYLSLKEYKTVLSINNEAVEYIKIFPCGITVSFMAALIFFILMFISTSCVFKHFIPHKKEIAITNVYKEMRLKYLNNSDIQIYQNILSKKINESYQNLSNQSFIYSDSLLSDLITIINPTFFKLDSTKRCIDSISIYSYQFLSTNNDSLCLIYQISKKDFNYQNENQFIYQIIGMTYGKLTQDSTLLKTKTADIIPKIDKDYTPLKYSFSGTFSILFYGIFFTIFIALFFSKHKKRFFEKGFAEEQAQKSTQS